jgi:hypothetical protein
VLSFVSVLVLGAGFGYWRISQGPLSLGFLSGPVERFVNSSLDGMRLRVKDVVIERDPESNTIHLRLRRAHLEDRDGQMIARAPRAGVGLSGAALLSGEIRPTDLEFIGPRILIKRTIDGSFQLGFGEAASQREDGVTDVSGTAVAEDLTGQHDGAIEPESGGFLAYLFQAFAARNKDDSATSDLDTIAISDAAVSIYDEANESFWYAPKTNLVFQRVPYGLSLLAHGNVSSGQHPWKLQLAADYIAETGRFKVTAKVFDLIPAEMSDLIFALSNLAKVQVPLNGEAHFEFDEKGVLLDAKASFDAGAGLVGFPGFITESVLVDEGALQLAFEPDSGDIVLEDSSIYVGGSRASLNGRFSPLYNDTGRLVSWRYRMSARNVSLDTQGTFRNLLAIDSFDIRGLAAIEEGRLDIEELKLTAGDSEIALRGTFIEGPEVPAVFLRGTMRNAALPVIKKLWPPEAAPGARNWIVENMSDETVLDGDLAVNLSSEALAAALDDAPLPNDQLSFAFKLRNVTTRYFRDLPAITNAEAEGLLRGNDLEVRLSQGEVTLDTGEQLSVANGRFYLENLAQPATMGDITVDISGTSTAILRLIDHEPLGYAKAAGVEPEDLGGNNLTRLHVRLPMLQEMTFDQVEIDARSELTEMALASVFEGGDIQSGTMVLNVDKQGLVGKGKVTLNGVKTELTWSEYFEKDKSTRIEAAALLTEQARKRLDLDLSGFLRGTVPVVIESAAGGGFERMHVEADLSKAEIFFEQLQWRRLAGKGAKASFDVHMAADGTTTVTNLVLKGPDHLSMRGSLTSNAKGELVRIDMPEVRLGAGNRFAVSGTPDANGVMGFRIVGDSFDARPIVDSMFSDDDAQQSAQAQQTQGGPSRINVVAQIKTLFFHNNEHLTNVTSNMQIVGGTLQRFRMNGHFANAKGMEVTIAPDANGQRPIQVLSDDAGASLRAINLYTRAHDGKLKLTATLGRPGSGEVKNGRLGIRKFIVRNEPVLRELGSTTQQTGNAQNRNSGDQTRFDVLKLKFEIDPANIRIVDEAIIHGPSIGSTVRGSIRRDNGRLNIAGTLSPAYALNSAIGNVPILGQVLLGGEGQGLIGVTFAVTGTFEKPRVTINPVSALAPGFLRRFLEIGGTGQPEPAGDTTEPQERRRKSKPDLK